MEHQKVSSVPSIRGEELIEDESEGNKGVVLLLISTTNPHLFPRRCYTARNFCFFSFSLLSWGRPLETFDSIKQQ
jgi:hypothetical protein